LIIAPLTAVMPTTLSSLKVVPLITVACAAGNPCASFSSMMALAESISASAALICAFAM
jgi:hypothetical protein